MKTLESRKRMVEGRGNKGWIALMLMAVLVNASQIKAEEVAAPVIKGDIYVTAVNKYLFRGLDFSPVSLGGTTSALMFQPGLDLYVGPFTLAFWNSISDLGTFDEMDITGLYASTFGLTTVSGGFTIYTYPSLLLGDTFEWIAKVAVAVPSAPSLGLYYDMVLEILYGELKLGHSLSIDAIPGLGLTAGASLGYAVLPSDMDASALSVLGLSLTPSYTAGPVVFSITGFYQLALDDAYDNDWYVSLGTLFNF